MRLYFSNIFSLQYFNLVLTWGIYLKLDQIFSKITVIQKHGP